MNSDQFDRLTQLVGSTSTRRRLLAATAAWVFSRMPSTPGSQVEEAGAKRKKNRGSRRANHRSERIGIGLGSADESLPLPLVDEEAAPLPFAAKGAPRPPVESVIAPLPDGTVSCALQVYDTNFTGSRFTGDRTILADITFHRSLDKINACANHAGIDLVPSSSYRSVVGENWDIYERIKWNNHVPGHAQDFSSIGGCGWETRADCAARTQKLIDTDPQKTPPPPQGVAVIDHYCPRGGGCLAREFEDYPEGTKKFLTCIMNTPSLKWGGEFKSGSGFDPIHIDDRLNQGNGDAYKNVPAYQERAQLAAYSQLTSPLCPSGTRCNMSTGRCEPECDLSCGECQVCKGGNQCVDDPDCCLPSCGVCTECKNQQCVPVECGPCSECQDNACVPLDCGECQECVEDNCIPIVCGRCSYCENNACVRDPECECVPISCPAGQRQDPVTCQCACSECLDQHDDCFDGANDRASACSAGCAGGGAGRSLPGESGRAFVPPTPEEGGAGGMDDQRDSREECDQGCQNQLAADLDSCNADFDACQASCGAGRSLARENSDWQPPRGSQRQREERKRQTQHSAKRRKRPQDRNGSDHHRGQSRHNQRRRRRGGAGR
jgi:hypothetical protein